MKHITLEQRRLLFVIYLHGPLVENWNEAAQLYKYAWSWDPKGDVPLPEPPKIEELLRLKHLESYRQMNGPLTRYVFQLTDQARMTIGAPIKSDNDSQQETEAIYGIKPTHFGVVETEIGTSIAAWSAPNRLMLCFDGFGKKIGFSLSNEAVERIMGIMLWRREEVLLSKEPFTLVMLHPMPPVDEAPPTS